jgi:hypothetical protein
MFLLRRNAFSDIMITPPAPALPPQGDLGACDARYFLYV